jgi:hypothetical protein
MKFAINVGYGGFGLSQEALQWLADNKDWKFVPENIDAGSMYYDAIQKLMEEGYKLYKTRNYSSLLGPISMLESTSDLDFRSGPDIIEVIEALGEEANGRRARIVIVEADEPISNLEINDYDGKETLQTIPKRFN